MIDRRELLLATSTAQLSALDIRRGLNRNHAPPHSVGQHVFLSEPGREGVFAFRQGDLSQQVLYDPHRAIYVPSVTDPRGQRGAWVRIFDGPLNVRWFGAAGDAVTDDAPAINGALNFIAAMNLNPSSTNRGGRKIFFPAGHYYCTTTILLRNATYHLIGEAIGQSGGASTILGFPAGVSGIIIHRYNTDGVSGPAVTTGEKGGDGSIIEGLQVYGGGAHATEAHGILMRARGVVRDCAVNRFSGHGIAVIADANSGSTEGNANNWRIDTVRVTGNDGSGVHVQGADANAGFGSMIDVAGNKRWGVDDQSFLGNTWVQIQSEFNGGGESGTDQTPRSNNVAGVWHEGRRYFVVRGQATAASRTTPGTNFAIWGNAGTAPLDDKFPQWVSGNTYHEGGAWGTNNGNARSLFLGCYSEGGQPPAQVASPSMGLGGHAIEGAGVVGSGAMGYMRLGSLTYTQAVQYRGETGDLSGVFVTARVGGEPDIGNLLAFEKSDTTGPIRLQWADSDLVLQSSNSATYRAFTITSRNTANQFGTGTVVDSAFHANKLMVGSSITDARLVTNGIAAPTTGTHAAGEIVWNRAPAVGQPMGWMCVTAGSPGTWLPLPLL